MPVGACACGGQCMWGPVHVGACASNAAPCILHASLGHISTCLYRYLHTEVVSGMSKIQAVQVHDV